jgi:intergrase/recombinase
MPIEYNALYNLLCDSGLRLIEATHVLNSFKDAEYVNGFYRSEVAMFRGCKQSYYSHFSRYTLNLLHHVERKLNEQIASTFFDKKNVVNPKYLRKYVFDKMIELEIPESVADFIEGRVPNRIGAKHYMALARQASNFYPKYLRHIENLRQRISD